MSDLKRVIPAMTNGFRTCIYCDNLITTDDITMLVCKDHFIERGGDAADYADDTSALSKHIESLKWASLWKQAAKRHRIRVQSKDEQIFNHYKKWHHFKDRYTELIAFVKLVSKMKSGDLAWIKLQAEGVLEKHDTHDATH